MCHLVLIFSIQQYFKKEYIPQPLDTSNVSLPEELLPLVEDLAKNVHEVFVQNRMKEGWKYGPVRDDAKKENPTMVPYEDLPESEKAYDRATSQETLKFILSKGFHISK